MQLQFEKAKHTCLQPLKREIMTQEETQEVRLTEDLPDIGSVLGSWGQVLMRGKEWRNGSMLMNGGVMTWVLYMPEDGSVPQCLEVWLPFQLRWELPDTKVDGRIQVQCMLRSVDARSVSARKLMVRATVNALGEAMIPLEIEIPVEGKIPDDIYLSRKQYPVQLPVEAGEKAFHLEESLALPGSCPQLKKLLCYGLQPELIDQKVMSDKVVFRGSALVHILYLSQEDSLCAWDFEVPFSQYAQLDAEYGQEAAARICMAVTGLELDVDQEGGLQLKAGLTGQYVIRDSLVLAATEDAYSNHRSVLPQTEILKLPTVKNCLTQTIRAEQIVPLEGATVIDIAFYSAWPETERNQHESISKLHGQFQILTCDDSGALQTHRVRWEHAEPLESADSVVAGISISGMPQASVQSGNTAVGCDLILATQMASAGELPVVTGLELGEPVSPDPDRPSVILRRSGGESLWQIAKSCGSDVETIRSVNHITDEPGSDAILLIPVQ